MVRVAPATVGTRETEAEGLSKESARLIVVTNAGNAAGAKGPCESMRVYKQRRRGDCREAIHTPTDSGFAEGALSACEAVAWATILLPLRQGLP